MRGLRRRAPLLWPNQDCRPADWDDVPQFTEEFRQAIRARFTRQIIVAGKYDKVRAEWVLSKGYADLVAFGRPFVSNPDLHVDSPRACR